MIACKTIQKPLHTAGCIRLLSKTTPQFFRLKCHIETTSSTILAVESNSVPFSHNNGPGPMLVMESYTPAAGLLSSLFHASALLRSNIVLSFLVARFTIRICCDGIQPGNNDFPLGVQYTALQRKTGYAYKGLRLQTCCLTFSLFHSLTSSPKSSIASRSVV